MAGFSLAGVSVKKGKKGAPPAKGALPKGMKAEMAAMMQKGKGK